MHHPNHIIISFVIIFFNYFIGQAAGKSLRDFCMGSFSQTTVCPLNLCQLGCANLPGFEGKCLTTCIPKPCHQIDAKECPLEECQLVKGCEVEYTQDACAKKDQDVKCERVKEVCFAKVDEPIACGPLGYEGQNVECCEGLIKRCGVAFFDGSCDLVGKSSVYAVPICIPCGNGICNQFENHCNCPEDCK